jgi:hypothetical protein
LIRFWPKVRKTATCWEWTGARTFGYGVIGSGGKYGHTLRAHRISWTIHRGRIPDGLELDHLCRNRACVRPDHLEPVTTAENVLRGALARIDACPQGHPYDEANTYRRPRFPNQRRCRACHRIQVLQSMRRLAA